jgi:hypothetical protein
MPNLAKIVSILVSLLLLAACGPSATPVAPSADPNLIRTEAAATVLARVTRDLALTPSATLIPTQTSTPAPEDTPTATLPAASAVTATSVTGAPVAGATGTPATPTAVLTNLAEWVSQTIPDGTTFRPGESFTMTWRVENVGQATWTEGYWLRYFSGDSFGAPREFSLGEEVKPGEFIDLTLQMTAPTRPGEYRSDWVLATEARSNFKEGIFLKIVVSIPTTPTRTATAAAVTPTASPTQ